LEDRAEEERVDAGELLCIAPDLDGLPTLQLRDNEGVDGAGDSVPLHRIGHDEGEVALDSLKAGELTRSDAFERQIVEAG